MDELAKKGGFRILQFGRPRCLVAKAPGGRAG